MPPRTIDHAVFLQALLDHLPVMVLAVASDGSIIWCNQPVSLACGWKDGEASSHRLAELIPTETAGALLRTPGAPPVRARSIGSPGNAPPPTIAWSCRRLRSPAQKTAAFLVVGRDIEREAQLEDFIAANQWFETAGALSGGLAHDFNNVLASVLGLSEIIGLRLPRTSPLREFTDKISQSIDRAKLLVRRFSQFSRKPAFLLEPQPMGLVLDDLRQMLAGFLPGSVELQTSISADTPWCQADRHALTQIILNCANLFRTHLRDDGGRIEMASSPVVENDRTAILVRGSGPGLAHVDVDSIFELRTERTGSAYESGAAMFAARRVAAASNLELTVRRDDPQTVTFTLRLPLAADADEVDDDI